MSAAEVPQAEYGWMRENVDPAIRLNRQKRQNPRITALPEVRYLTVWLVWTNKLAGLSLAASGNESARFALSGG